MANIKSQIKRIRTNEAARLRNKARQVRAKTAVRSFREAADSGDAAKATAALQSASRKLDKAVSKGVIHKNQAANRSRRWPSRSRRSSPGRLSPARLSRGVRWRRRRPPARARRPDHPKHP